VEYKGYSILSRNRANPTPSYEKQKNITPFQNLIGKS
jgi:hypothetical protein